MTNGEKFKEVFKFGLRIDGSDFITREMITCSDLSCSECPLDNVCSNKGMKKWLETEYGEKVELKRGEPEKKGESKDDENSAYKKGYEDGISKGYEDGRNQAYAELSKIFKR